MMSRRHVLMIGGLAAAAAVRWFDPLGASTGEVAPASAAIERANSRASLAMPVPAALAVAPVDAWPVRQRVARPAKDEDLFASRSALMAQAEAAKRLPPAPPPPPPVVMTPYVPPSPLPPPMEPAPNVQVIGTWGEAQNLSVFLAGPQGTLHVKVGDVLMSVYKVQSVTKQQLTLINQSTQKVWQLAIPDAPSVLKTWPGR